MRTLLNLREQGDEKKEKGKGCGKKPEPRSLWDTRWFSGALEGGYIVR